MRFLRPFVCAIAVVCVSLPASAQAPKLQFLNRLKDDATV